MPAELVKKGAHNNKIPAIMSFLALLRVKLNPNIFLGFLSSSFKKQAIAYKLPNSVSKPSITIVKKKINTQTLGRGNIDSAFGKTLKLISGP